MDGNVVVIGTQVGVGVGLVVTLGIPLLKLSAKWGRTEQKLDDLKEDCDSIKKNSNNKPCCEHGTRLARVEGFIEGRNSVKDK